MKTANKKNARSPTTQLKDVHIIHLPGVLWTKHQVTSKIGFTENSRL